MHHLRQDPEQLGQPCGDHEPPWCVHARTERRMHHHAPIADLIGERLDDQARLIRKHPGSGALLIDVRLQGWKVGVRFVNSSTDRLDRHRVAVVVVPGLQVGPGRRRAKRASARWLPERGRRSLDRG